jgi:hypothetical protein
VSARPLGVPDILNQRRRNKLTLTGYLPTENEITNSSARAAAAIAK